MSKLKKFSYFGSHKYSCLARSYQLFIFAILALAAYAILAYSIKKFSELQLHPEGLSNGTFHDFHVCTVGNIESAITFFQRVHRFF